MSRSARSGARILSADGLENRILERFPDVLKEADHRFRMERYLLKENWSAATRAAGFAGREYATLVKARMGLYRGKKAAEKAFAEVPASLRKDASYIFSRALDLRRNKQYVEAAKVLSEAPRDAEVPRGWGRMVGRASPDHPRASGQERSEGRLRGGEPARRRVARAADRGGIPFRLDRAAFPERSRIRIAPFRHHRPNRFDADFEIAGRLLAGSGGRGRRAA